MKVEGINFGVNAGTEKLGNGTGMDGSEAEAAQKREKEVIRSLCSLQSRMGPPEYRKWRRVHGLQLPLHPMQVVGWIIFLAVGAATFLVLIPALRPFFRECLLVVLASLFTLHILSHLAALLLDPADPKLRGVDVKLTVPEFDRTKHAHVIENGRCHLCNIKTSSLKTKHCSVCNKCVDHFDHHCKWLNHCIGGKNYVAFLICVVTAVVAALVIVGVSVLEMVCYHVNPGLMDVFARHPNGTIPGSFLPESVFLGVIGTLGLVAATTAGLLLHLCLFHCYISFLGITTYEYIRNYRQDMSEPRILPCADCHKKGKVLFNRAESSATIEQQRQQQQQTNRGNKSKFFNCYYFWSRPPEEENEETCCPRPETAFCCGKGILRGDRTRKKKTLKRQNTDPEFVDKVIKPFLITLGDEKNTTEMASEFESPPSCVQFVSENKCRHCACGSAAEEEQCDESRNEEDRGKHHFAFTKLQFLGPKALRPHSSGSADKSVKIKCNQVRPSTADCARDKASAIKKNCRPEGPDLDAFAVMHTKVLPELNESFRRLRTTDQLKELNSVLDLVDRQDFALHLKSNYRKMKKNMAKRPRSPLLSPIRESGFSNPGSPRVDLNLPPSPVFVRPPSPETSTIFLSNPNSLSSSDEEDIFSPPTPIIHRHYDSEDVLKTPQLPRKVFTPSKEDQIFVLRPSRTRSSKWIDVEIRN